MSRRKPSSRKTKKSGHQRRQALASLGKARMAAASAQPPVDLPPEPDALTGELQAPRPQRSGRYDLTRVWEYLPEDPRSQVSWTPEGNPGIYAVSYVLSLPGQAMYHTRFSLEELKESGDSLLLMPRDTTGVTLTINAPSSVTIVGYANAHGSLARLEMRVDATGFEQAQQFAHDWIAPILSWWSFLEDVEIDVAGVHVLEESSGASRWRGGILGQYKRLAPHAGHVSKPEHRALLASYREGLIATNPFYKALCHYRVIEGVVKMRNARRSALLNSGQQYREPEQSIPADGSVFDEMERNSFLPYLGWRFNRVRDEMRALIRNATAHLDPWGDSLVADEYEDVEACARAVPVLRYVARQMLRFEIEADPDYGGIVVP